MVPTKMVRSRVWRASAFTLWSTFSWNAVAQTASFNEFTIPTPASRPQGITPGPDAAMWFVESSADKIGRVTDSGIITEFALLSGSHPQQIVRNYADGNLWFTATQGNYIGRITTAGVITQFPVPTPNASPFGIAEGQGTGSATASLWFTETAANKIGSITTDGVITEYPIPTANASSANITIGAMATCGSPKLPPTRSA